MSSPLRASVPTDPELMLAVSRGDESAMAALYDRYSALSYGVALRVLRNPQAAQDVLQEVFIQLWRNPGTFDCNRGSLPAWLAVISRNRAIDFQRRQHGEVEIPESVSMPVDLEGETERRIAVGKVQSVLAQIPEEQRNAIQMAFFQGMTHTEIAEQTKQPLGTIKTRIRSALLALRKALAE